MPRGKVTIIHWTDPRYLEEFYKAWGSGQSITSRQAQPKMPEDHSTPKHSIADDKAIDEPTEE